MFLSVTRANGAKLFLGLIPLIPGQNLKSGGQGVKDWVKKEKSPLPERSAEKKLRSVEWPPNKKSPSRAFSGGALSVFWSST